LTLELFAPIGGKGRLGAKQTGHVAKTECLPGFHVDVPRLFGA